jgi:hypothetical protein
VVATTARAATAKSGTTTLNRFNIFVVSSLAGPGPLALAVSAIQEKIGPITGYLKIQCYEVCPITGKSVVPSTSGSSLSQT